MDPIVLAVDPVLVAVSVIFILGALSGLILFWAWLEEDRDQELSKHTEDILSRYMRR